jgi:hypothetical protein
MQPELGFPRCLILLVVLLRWIDLEMDRWSNSASVPP